MVSQYVAILAALAKVFVSDSKDKFDSEAGING